VQVQRRSWVGSRNSSDATCPDTVHPTLGQSATKGGENLAHDDLCLPFTPRKPSGGPGRTSARRT